MDDLEARLRQSLQAQVATPPQRPALADVVVQRGRRVRQRRRVALVAAVVLAGTSLGLTHLPGSGSAPEQLAATPSPPDSNDEWLADLPAGPPAETPLVVGGLLRTLDRDVDLGSTPTAAASWKGGVLVATDQGVLRWTSAAARLDVLAPAEEVARQGVVASRSGAVAYMTRIPGAAGSGLRRTARQVNGGRLIAEFPSSRNTGGPHAPPGDVIGFVGDEVLFTVRPDEGDGAPAERVEAWNPMTGRTRTVGPGRYTEALAVHTAGLVALTLTSGCHEVSELSQRRGLWSSCEAVPKAFSPDGSLVLAQRDDSLIIVDARTGEGTTVLALPTSDLAAYAWGSNESVIALVRTSSGLAPVRCAVARGLCERAGPPVGQPDEPAFVVTVGAFE